MKIQGKMFWSIENSGEVLSKLKSKGFQATSLSTYEFSLHEPLGSQGELIVYLCPSVNHF